jgi:hypothetical protein
LTRERPPGTFGEEGKEVSAMRLRTAGSALVAVAALAVAAPDATLGAEAPERAPTAIRLKEIVETMSGDGEYSGRVRSPRAHCRRGRTVEILHLLQPPTTLGATSSDEHGKFKLTAPLPADGETVVVRTKRTKRCKGARETYEVRR